MPESMPITKKESIESFDFEKIFTIGDLEYIVTLSGSNKRAKITFCLYRDLNFGTVTNRGLVQSNLLMHQIAVFAKEKINEYGIDEIYIYPFGKTSEKIDKVEADKISHFLSDRMDILAKDMEGHKWQEYDYFCKVKDGEVLISIYNTDESFNLPNTKYSFDNFFSVSDIRKNDGSYEDGDMPDQDKLVMLKPIIEGTSDLFWKDFGERPNMESLLTMVQEGKGEKGKLQRQMLYTRFIKNNFPDVDVVLKSEEIVVKLKK